MSYLNALRLHFAGTFQASVSTVNNDPEHYDNSTFQPNYQEMQNNPPSTPPNNGWWNPTGDAAWRLIGCKITSAFMPDGTPIAKTDPVSGYTVADSDGRVSAKLADLDPDQQMVSMIFGLQVRIADQNGNTLLSGDYDPAAFTNIWQRVPTAGGDGAACAMYQSVILNLGWGDVSCSPFLTALKAASNEGLSIKFNVDQYDDAFTSPAFTRGRIVGTIGPAAASEPRHFVNGRQLSAVNGNPGGFFAPQGLLNFAVAWVDKARGKVFLDLGNSLPTTDVARQGVYAGLANLGLLTLKCGTITLGSLDPKDYFHDPTWYGRTAGVVEWPASRSLTAAELSTLKQHPLTLTGPGTGGHAAHTSELPTGLYVRADQFVFRMNPNPGETDNQVTTAVYATKFGEPAVGHKVTAYNLSILNPDDLNPNIPAAQRNNLPVPLKFAAPKDPDGQGKTSLTITAGNPDLVQPGQLNLPQRASIDGQIFGVALALQGDGTGPTTGPLNPSDFISILVWSSFPKEDPITWFGSLQPIFQQYENLYPIMKRFMRLGDYDEVVENAGLLVTAFSLDPSDPNSMPVTRDLSEAKRKAILAWLTATSADKTPLFLKGTLPAATQAEAVPPAKAPTPLPPVRGGKAAFLLRRKLSLARHAQK